ncbi:DUF4407 domain-containing protein, partial [Frankia sp. Cr1]|uniref:DUF4407 domain-containing protein n=1 Tax=Frankia sp. Cr1 TaxID=3073931 RepID=UPI002AD419D6
MRYERRRGRLTDRLLGLAGIDPDHATEFIDRARYVCAALFMVIYGVYATVGCAFFLMIATGGGFFPGVLVGLLVATAVILYDRFLLSQVSVNLQDLDNDDAPSLGKTKIPGYAGRVVITMLTAVVLTDPLILKMFNAEITGELSRQSGNHVRELNAAVEQRRQQLRTDLDVEIAKDEKDLQDAQRAVAAADGAAQNERKGAGATGLSGTGDTYKLLYGDYTRALARQNLVADTLGTAQANKPAKIQEIDVEAARQTADNIRLQPKPEGILNFQRALLSVLGGNAAALLLCVLIYLLLFVLDLAVLLF